jgi:tetratricopeptide (TPR) repeat protein
LDEQAIRAMLIEHLGRLKYALFERDEGERNRFVEAVTRKSEGLPLYVWMVIEDLKVRRWTVWDEDKLPPGLVAYYEWLLEQLGVSDVKAVLTPLFCLLAWAKEPITEGTMKVLLQTYFGDAQGWDELFRKTLEYGHQMLQQRPTSDDETGWTIYHDSFRQHLLESETVSFFRGMAQGRWLKVCEDWKALASQEPSLHRYILRHYAEHLYDKWRMTNEQMTYDALCQLALDPEFAQAQTKHLPKEPNLPLKTVQLALDAAIQLEGAPMMARLLIEHAKRAQEETPLQAWRREHQERALKMVTDIVFQRNHRLGTLWSLLLAWVAESEGKSEEERSWSKRFLDEVRKRWEGGKLEKLRDWDWDWEGKMAAFLLGELGQVEGAIEVAGLVLGDVSKRELAASWASKELFDRALKVAEGIENAWERARALREIAEGMWKAGMFDRALKVAEGIEDARERAWALREIAGEMAKAGMIDWAKEVFDRALKVAEGIEDAWRRAEALAAIAKEMAEAGMFDRALKVAEGIEGARERARALREIAGEMAEAGVQDEALWRDALKVAEGIEDADERAWALMEIAEGMAKAGMVDQALKVTEGIEWAWERAETLAAIAVGMAKAGMVEQALKVAEGIEDAGKQAEALMEIAEGMAKAGMFDRALKVAEGIEGARERARALREIAGEMAEAGVQDEALWRDALKVAEGIEDADERAWALMEIAEGMAKAGMVDQALKVTEGIEWAWERAKTLGEIAVGMAKAGMEDWAKEVFEQALKVAEGIEDAGERAGALREIAVEMAKAGEVEGAVSIVEREMAVRTKGLPSVLEVLAERAREGDGKSKEGFLRLLPLCGWSLEFACYACGLLHQLYPERGEEIAGVVSSE